MNVNVDVTERLGPTWPPSSNQHHFFYTTAQGKEKPVDR